MPGYTGTNCQTLYNPCLLLPCVRGTCINLNTTFSCSCPTGTIKYIMFLNKLNIRIIFQIGFLGTFCELDINECTSPSACFNNAACVNTIGSYQCICNTGYTGAKCELNEADYGCA